MPITEVYEKLSLSGVENVLALKGYSGYRLCYFVPYWERVVCGRPRERLRRPGYYFVCNPLCVRIFLEFDTILLFVTCSRREK